MPVKSTNNQYVLKNGRSTIAVLVGSMTSEYHEGIMRGAAHVAAEKNYNLIAYCGGVLNSSDPLTLTREKVFELVDMDLIDGVISPFSSHSRFLDKKSSRQFIEQFSSVPVINIGSRVEGYTNVLTDYETGFSELFEHLFQVHRCRKIILVRGPEHHASSEKRMQLYKSLLQQYGLPFDEELVIYSNLNRGSVKVKIESYLDSINKPFDSIIAVNDNQALGAIDAFQERGIQVPEDVVVVGSMNTLEGAFSTPALSSIQEPLFELGRSAAIELIEQIEGKSPLSEIHIPTSLTIRQSCGCASPTHYKEYKSLCNLTITSFNMTDDPIFKETQVDFERTVEQYKGGIIASEVTSILTLYQQAIYNKKFDGFLNELQKKLESALKSEDIMLWLALTTKLQLSTLQYLELDPEQTSLISFISRLIILKNEIEQVTIKFQRFETEYYLNYFRAIVNNLNSSFDLTTIKKYTVDILQLSELYISLFHDVNADVITATNMVSVRDNKFIELENNTFNAKKLLPNNIKHYHERYTLMVFPLAFRNKAIGFMTLNLSNRKGTAFENLRAIISSALKNEMLIQDLKNAEKRFSDIAHSTSNWLWETDVNNRFTYCSNSSLDIIGYSSEELINTEVGEFNVGGAYVKSMLAHEDLNDVECWCKHQSGKVICLLISAKPNLAYSDILTGLPNRTLFQDKLAETILHSSTHGQKCALMFIDLDHFKNINDSMGHAAGDLLLIELSKRLSDSIRSNDFVARLGVDEFVIILRDIVNDTTVINIAQRIFSYLEAPILIHGKPIYSTLSLGISVYPTDGQDAQSLLQKGDNAMYQAKSQGRNGYVFYDKLLEQKNSQRTMNVEILREAINSNGFILYYQPLVSTHNGDIIGLEALVRIKDSKKGIVAPTNFIPLAEELGIIGQIDEWVFNAVCKQYTIWRESGLKIPRLSINLSALQLCNDAVLDTYLKILEQHNIPPSAIQLEITENALIENEQVALRILNGFKSHGIRIALDDFGTGYSSLSCINLYPIDTIKIDRTFVKDAVDNPKNKAIIEGTVLIASSLNLNIVAEGVETQEQYEFIKQLGCHEIQGYYFYKPCPVVEVQALMLAL